MTKASCFMSEGEWSYNRFESTNYFAYMLTKTSCHANQKTSLACKFNYLNTDHGCDNSFPSEKFLWYFIFARAFVRINYETSKGINILLRILRGLYWKNEKCKLKRSVYDVKRTRPGQFGGTPEGLKMLRNQRKLKLTLKFLSHEFC